MNLSVPINFFTFILFAFFALEYASAAEDSQPRVNPFELPHGIYSQENAPKEQPQDLVLQAIFNIKGKHIVTISGQNFIKGDFAFGKRVTSISNNQVILDAGGKEEILLLEKTRFRIKKHDKK
ncbi:MAG: hypothetical protein F3745_09970 [Nitrospinae bacterium]|nr:hypothetical protein [Nitrospinota bacterium]